MKGHVHRIDPANLDTTVVSPSFVFTVTTNIKGMELCLTGTFDECS
jgi:hypothetical protein